MEDPYSLLADEIQHQYSKISNSFNFDRRLAITEIVRCIDHSFVFISYILPVTHSTYQSAAEIHRFMATGYNQALRIFFDDSTCLSGAPLYPTNGELIDWTNSVLINLGHIGYTLRFIELSKQGLFKLEKKDKYFRFIGLSNTPGKEKQGANDFYWWQNQNEINGDDLGRLQNLAPKIKELLHSESKVWNNHFIQYGSTPELDTYYETLAKHYSSNYLGYDSFHENAIFGDVSYSEIRQVLQALIGYTLKHKDHCAALLSKTNYTINPWNIYTLSTPVDNLADTISEHKSIATTKVKTIIDVLTINRDNIDKLLAIPGSAPAPLIKIGKDHVLRSVCGTLSNPFDFLTASLKLNFASSYFKAVNDRENIFREELYSLLDNPRFIKTSRGITLRDRGKILTDIDAMVYDPDSKCLFIIQLKWLEDFGTSMKMRYSMQRNFYSSSIKWVENVLEWLRINGSRFLLAGQKDFASYINDEVTVQLLILGRNFSHFSDSQDDKRAIWYSWYRLLKSISSNPKIKGNLFSLAAYMKSHCLQEEKSPKELSDELQVGKYKIQIKI